MEGKRRRIASFADTGGPRAPLRSNFDDAEAFSEEECSQQDVVQRMVPVACSPIIMCGTSGCSGSCSVSAVENGYVAGKKPATCQTCGKIFPCLNSWNASPVTCRRSRNTSPAMSRRSSVVSWSDSPLDQAVSKSVEAVMVDCTESHQIWNDTLGEPVLHSSGFADASEHAAISGCVETRVECTVSHGLGKSGGNGTIRTFPVHLGTQFAQVGYLGVESVLVISGFLLSHQRLYKANLASIVLCLTVLMWPCLVDPVEKARLLRISQGLNLVRARSTHMLAIPKMNWCLELRTSAGRNVTSRRFSANPRRSKKLNEMRSASSLHNLRSAMKPLSLF